MVKSVPDVSISLDDYGGQKLKFVRQAETGSILILIDHLIFHDLCSTNHLFSDMILDVYNFPQVTVLGTTWLPMFKSACEFCQRIDGCGIANFERTSFATRASEQFGGGFAELCTVCRSSTAS